MDKLLTRHVLDIKVYVKKESIEEKNKRIIVLCRNSSFSVAQKVQYVLNPYDTREKSCL
jgi:hypothetical protein